MPWFHRQSPGRLSQVSESAIPVIDLFAGPGGLGEGFSSLKTKGAERFSIALSIEKDPIAHRTLLLRSFFRGLKRKKDPYYARLRGEIQTATLFENFPDVAAAAKAEAVCLELGPNTRSKVDVLVAKALQHSPKKWVLIGGPPCQAYSLVGRSRMRGADEVAYQRDGRHFLYREYLRILRKFQPPVFVMENVKGLLSSTVLGRETFRDILRDLSSAGYSLHSFVRASVDRSVLEPNDFVIRGEEYGIPQARHRVILFGIRTDLERGSKLLEPQVLQVPIEQAIGDLPPLRSAISKSRLNGHSWESTISATATIRMEESLQDEIAFQLAKPIPTSLGSEFIDYSTSPNSPWLRAHSDWFYDRSIGGVVHHASRSHMPEDLQRYFYAACYAIVNKKSPKIAEFPRKLWPEHENVKAAADGGMFSDRFRVQRRGRPATTVVSHISKDGHYFIHYDPRQCRSLTVREAARLQTFPDNYFFEGPRTEQYHQVGNAVPPLLGRQLAEVVSDVLSQIT
jgi:DNA (cytosine-5)-methyltransferase 1